MSNNARGCASILTTLAIACAVAAFTTQPVAAQTAKKLKCVGCVKSQQLKDSGIRSQDLKNKAVTGKKIAPGAVDGSKISEGAVGFSELDSSLQQRIDDAGLSEYIWLPAADAVVRFGDSTQAHVEVESFGRACVEQDVGGSLLVDVFFPIQVDVPRARNYQVVSAQISYEAPVSTAFINRTEIQGRIFDTGAGVRLAQDFTRRTSTSFGSYTINVTENETVTESLAPTNVALQLRMTAIGSSVCFYGVRLQLG